MRFGVSRIDGRVGAVGTSTGCPTSLRLSSVIETTDLGRVSHVSDETDLNSFSDDDQAAQIEAAMADARARLADVPAEVVVTNHVMGMYELAAIHLSSATPDLVSASLAIDSMALLVEGLQDRLGDDAPTMRDALANIRMAFVAVKSQTGQATTDAD
jgi:hypothetical protein